MRCRRLADSSSGRLKAFEMVMAETPRCLAKDFRFTSSRRGALDLAVAARRTRQLRLGDYNVKDTKSSLLPLTLKSSPFSLWIERAYHRAGRRCQSATSGEAMV